MKLKFLTTVFAGALCLQTAAATDLAAAQKLLAQGQATAAYAQLHDEADAHAGEPDFDYTYGTAAVDSGHLEEAITVLERVLAVNPQHAGARMELARAYFLLGADDLATHEFSLLLQQNPPPDAHTAIDKYLAAIAIRKQGAESHFNGYINGGLGHDSNITAVTSDFAGATNLTTPTGNSILRQGAYSKWGGGFNYNHPFGNYWWDTAADLSVKDYFKYSAYDDTELLGTLGVGQRFGDQRLHMSLLGLRGLQETVLGTANNPSTNNHVLLGIGVDWSDSISEQTQSVLQLQFNRLTFADVPVNNIRQVQLTGTLTHGYGGPLKPLTSGSLYAGYDQAYHPLPQGDDYSRRNFGLRMMWQITPLPNLDTYANLTCNRRLDISAARDITDQSRNIHDTTAQIGLGGVVHHNTAWSTRLEYLYSHNDSSHPLYTYTRNELNLTVRYDFH